MLYQIRYPITILLAICTIGCQKESPLDEDWKQNSDVAAGNNMIVTLHNDGSVHITHIGTNLRDLAHENLIAADMRHDILDVEVIESTVIAIHKNGDVSTFGEDTSKLDGLSNVKSISHSWNATTAVHLDNSLTIIDLDGQRHYSPETPLIIKARGNSFLTSDHTLYSYEQQPSGEYQLVAKMDNVGDFSMEWGGIGLIIKTDGTIEDLGVNAVEFGFVTPAYDTLSSYTDYSKIESSGVLGNTEFVAALRKNGSIVSWGNFDDNLPDTPKALEGIYEILVDQNGQFAAITNSGAVLTWNAKSNPTQITNLRQSYLNND